MTKWVPVPKPAAELALDPTKEHEVFEGHEIDVFLTKNGVRFARMVEPTGFVLWLQEVPG